MASEPVFADSAFLYALVDKRDWAHTFAVNCLRSLVVAQRPLVCTDHVIAESLTLAKARAGSVAALRHGLRMTGGFSFVFDPKNDFALVDGYRRAMWSVPAPLQDRRRTGFFLGLNHRFGLPQAYQDVGPPVESGGTA